MNYACYNAKRQQFSDADHFRVLKVQHHCHFIVIEVFAIRSISCLVRTVEMLAFSEDIKVVN